MKAVPAHELEHARALDAADPLAAFRERFELPVRPDGTPVAYFCGNSLGLMPRQARDCVVQELDDWARLAVEAHFEGRTPWYGYHEALRDAGARIVGARPSEVVWMNGLTTNLHLMMTSFYRPEGRRTRVLMDWPAFPSDIYAIRSHVRARGLDPDAEVLVVRPREGAETLETDDVVARLEAEGDTIALVLCAGVNYYTGQAMDIARISAAARARGCRVGWDLAHAAGNVPLQLHDWDADFACWCSYKYLNGGPGAIAGCFVHERNARDTSLPRLAGWWGNDPGTRFRMHLEPEFVPVPTADGWQLSNPPIMAMAALRASLALFDEAGMSRLRAKSLRLTGYLRDLLEQLAPDEVTIITPREEDAHGCQLSLYVHREARARFDRLHADGVACDFREPNVIRAAPVPLYNTFEDAWRLATGLCAASDA